MKVEQNPKIRLSLVRVLGNLAKNCGKRAKQIVADAGVPFFLNALNTKVRVSIKLYLRISAAKFFLNLYFSKYSPGNDNNTKIFSSNMREITLDEDFRRLTFKTRRQTGIILLPN
jgi:hypothetical protein